MKTPAASAQNKLEKIKSPSGHPIYFQFSTKIASAMPRQGLTSWWLMGSYNTLASL